MKHPYIEHLPTLYTYLAKLLANEESVICYE